MRFIRKNGATSNVFRVMLRRSDTGQGLTGLTGASSGLIISTIADNEASATTYTAAASHIQTIATLGTFAAPSANSCRFAEVDATNHPGLYELQIADARFAVSSSKQLDITISGATTLLAKEILVQLTAADVDSATNLGLSALPTANPGANGGLPTVDANNNLHGLTPGTGTGQINASGGKVPATVASGDGVDAASIKTTIGVAGAGLTAVPDTSGTTTLLARLTAARAGYLDNLNVGGNVASHADILAINQSASKHLLLVTVGQYAPGETYTIEMRTYQASDGSAVNADTTPTLTGTGTVSGNLSGNLSAATNPATGVYRWTYTPGATPTLEQIRFDGSATISSATFTLSCYAQTVDEPTVVWTATDQSHLTAIFNKLPSNNIADETLLLAAIGTPMQAGSVTLAASQPAVTFASWTCTGTMTVSGGIVVTNSNTNGIGLSITGTGSGQGAKIIGGATDGTEGLRVMASFSTTNADAIKLVSSGTGLGINGTLGTVKTVTSGVTVTTNNDKTGYALTSGEESAIAAAVWAAGSRTLSSFGFSLTTTVGGYASGQDPATSVWGAATTSFTGAGTFGLAVQQSGSSPSAIANAVWSTALPGSFGAGTAGVLLAGAGVAGNPWAATTAHGTSYGAAFEAMFTVTVPGSRTDAADHSTTSLWMQGQATNTQAKVTSTQTQTTQTVTVH